MPLYLISVSTRARPARTGPREAPAEAEADEPAKLATEDEGTAERIAAFAAERPVPFHRGPSRLVRALPEAAAGTLAWTEPHGMPGWENACTALDLAGEEPHARDLVALGERLLGSYARYALRERARVMAVVVAWLDKPAPGRFSVVREAEAFYLVARPCPYDELVATWSPDDGLLFSHQRAVPL